MLVKAQKIFLGDFGDVFSLNASFQEKGISMLLKSFSVSGVKILPGEMGAFVSSDYWFPLKGAVVESVSREKFGKVSCFNKSYFFKIVPGDLKEEVKQVQAIIDETLSGNIVSKFEFKDGSYVSAVSMGSGQPVYSQMLLEGKPSSQAGIFLKRLQAMSLKKRTDYIETKAKDGSSLFEIVAAKRNPSRFRVFATKMSRVVEHFEKALAGEGTLGIFTAYQKTGKGTTVDEAKNKKNYRELGNILKNLLSGPIPMDRMWQGVAENSYMVPDITLDWLKALSNRYNQDAFIYSGPETEGTFQLWGSPSPGSGPETYQVITSWDNYAVTGIEEPEGYSKLPGKDTADKFSFYEGGDTPEEYLKALDDLNSWVNKGLEQLPHTFPEAKREERVREKHPKLKEQVVAKVKRGFKFF